MALKLRRGTDAERQLITPEAGEPLWIDNEALWIGDGSTVGGIKVTGGIENDLATVSIDALSDVDTTSSVPQAGESLVWSAVESAFIPATPILNIDDLSNVDVSSNPPNNGDSLVWTGATWEPGSPTFDPGGAIVADLTGSVFANDSTLVIDGSGDPHIYTSLVTARSNDLRFFPENDLGDTFVTIESNSPNTSVMSLLRNSLADISSDTVAHGRITFSREDSVNGLAVTASITGRNDALFFYQDSAANAGDASRYITWKDGAFGIGTTTPSATLDVQGAIMPGVYADTDARDTAIPTPVAGMMIYLTSTNKHQGYNGTAWTDMY